MSKMNQEASFLQEKNKNEEKFINNKSYVDVS